MTETKQQQLERISRMIPKWNDAYQYAELMTNPSINMTGYRFTDYPSGDYEFITREEWQQELAKMQKKNDRSWHECGELPPVGCECLSPGGEIVMIASHGSISSVPVAFYPFGVGGLYSAACAKQFRPLRTEREKAIDAACEVIGGVIGGRLIIERLYDAGMLK